MRKAVLFERFVAEIKNDDLYGRLIEAQLCLTLPLLSEIAGKTAMTFAGVEVLSDMRVIPKCVFCIMCSDRMLVYFERLCDESFEASVPDSRTLKDMIKALDHIMSEYDPKMIREYNARLTEGLAPQLLALLKKRTAVRS